SAVRISAHGRNGRWRGSDASRRGELDTSPLSAGCPHREHRGQNQRANWSAKIPHKTTLGRKGQRTIRVSSEAVISGDGKLGQGQASASGVARLGISGAENRATIIAMPSAKITSLQNPRVKEAVKLRDRKGREQLGRILIEGLREISRALEAGGDALEAFVCDELCEAPAAAEVLDSLRQRKKVSLFSVTAPVMAKLSFGDRQEGLIVIARPPQMTLADLSVAAKKRGGAPLFAVVEGVEKPGNLGAIL